MSDARNNIRNAVKGAKPAKASPPERGQTKRRKELTNYDLPQDCPVIPIGLKDDKYFYIDASRQLRVLAASKHQRLEIMAMFGTQAGLLFEIWPRIDDQGRVSGWKPELAGQALMEAAAAEGVVDDIVDRVRGAGCWTDDNGDLVMHCGDKVYIGGEVHAPGRIGDHVYPAAQKKPGPSENDSPSAAHEILALLQTWNWRRPDIDPYLMLGWIGAAMIGGALDWRPAAWLTGDRATGKSTLHEMIGFIMGRGSLIQAADATAAGIWQSVGMSSLPVALDEMESEEDNRRNSNIVNLARLAASGGVILRGGADHGKVSFNARSCFLFSSILIPPLRSQDVSRLAILQLDPVSGTNAPSLNPDNLSQAGRIFRRRYMKNWPRFRDTLEAYRLVLADKGGHGGRSADQFGTLMACYDLLTSDFMPDTDTLEEWAEKLKRCAMHESEDDLADYERCLAHLMSSPLDLYRSGEKRSVGSWVMQAGGMRRGYEDMASMDEAKRCLANYGMKVTDETIAGVNHKMLIVANSHQGLSSIFRETHWSGRSGTSGVWVQSLRRIPGATAGTKAARFDGVVTRYTEIPLQNIMKAGDFDEE